MLKFPQKTKHIQFQWYILFNKKIVILLQNGVRFSHWKNQFIQLNLLAVSENRIFLSFLKRQLSLLIAIWISIAIHVL